MRFSVLACGLAGMVLAAGAAGAEILRDSDGEVISVLPDVEYTTGGPVRGGPGGGVWVTNTSSGPAYFAFRGNPVPGTSVTLNGTAWQVEQSGGRVWLMNPDTGDRVPGVVRAAARPDAQGRKVNPAAFALD
jgi:hypothetical protein